MRPQHNAKHALPHLLPLSAHTQPPKHTLLRRQLYDLLSLRERRLLCESKPRYLQAEHRDLILESVSVLQETSHPPAEQLWAHGLVTRSRSAVANRGSRLLPGLIYPASGTLATSLLCAPWLLGAQKQGLGVHTPDASQALSDPLSSSPPPQRTPFPHRQWQMSSGRRSSTYKTNKKPWAG